MNKRPKETMEKNKNKMSNRDKVAMILTEYEFSIEEGLNLYDKMMTNNQEMVIFINREADCVVWLETYYTEKPGRKINLTIWKNYRNDFCENYAVAGAIALDDDELNVGDDKQAFLDFFRECNRTCHETLPLLPKELRYIFTQAALTDYMLEYDSYEVSDDTRIIVKTDSTPIF